MAFCCGVICDRELYKKDPVYLWYKKGEVSGFTVGATYQLGAV